VSSEAQFANADAMTSGLGQMVYVWVLVRPWRMMQTQLIFAVDGDLRGVDRNLFAPWRRFTRSLSSRFDRHEVLDWPEMSSTQLNSDETQRSGMWARTKGS
jgi:hypothetical protein